MSLEDLTGAKYIDSLNEANPAAGDNVSEGDDHIRGIKNTIKNTFPNINGAVNASDEELNILDGVTATASEINKLDGLTATTTELNYVDGVTSAIQTQLDAKIEGNETITLSGDVSGSGTTSISVSLAADSVDSDELADNSVDASHLNVSGNGTSGQLLESDGDGSFSWADAPSGGQDGGVAWFTSSGNWTVPANVQTVRVICVGGGGSGGLSNNYSAGGGGGGGGATAMGAVNGLTAGSSISVTVGGNAGTSSFGNHMTAGGGGNGNNAPGWKSPGNGGSGGNASGGDVNLSGQGGGGGGYSDNTGRGGIGGYPKAVPYAPRESANPSQGNTTSQYNGDGGRWYGGGGHGGARGGGSGYANGGNGYQGVVYLEW